VGRKENELNRENASLEQIETAMDCARTQEDYKRLVVINYLYRGYARPVVEDLTRFAPSTVRKLIALFNARGIDGVVTKPRPGRPRKVPHAEFTDRVVPLLESPQEHGFSYMTVVKLHGHLTTEMRYEVSYSSVLRYVHSAGFSLKVPRRSHPDQDQERRKEFVEELNRELGRRDTEVWFEQSSKPRWIIEIKSTTSVDERHARALTTLRDDFKGAKALLISNDPTQKDFSGVRALHWTEAIKKIVADF
jgi:transposase